MNNLSRYQKIMVAVGEGVLLLVIFGFVYFQFFPSSPYAKWPMEDAKTGKHIIKDPPEVTVGIGELTEGVIWNRATFIASNGFTFPVGKVSVKVQMRDKDGAVIGDKEESTAALNAGDKGKVTFWMIPKGAAVSVSEVYAYEP